MFEVRRLRLLRELARHGTIAATAQALCLTPSAVSQQLALLEREAGAPLLVRDGRRLALTEAARILVGHTESVLAELERAGAAVASLRTSVRGTVRLSSFPSAAAALAAPAIAACRTAHPDLRVLLDEAEPEEGVTALRTHATDLALVYEYNLLPRIRDRGVVLLPLLAEPLLVALPPHTAVPAPRGVVRLADVRGEPWIAPHSDAALRTVLQRACQAAGFDPRLDYTSDDYTVIMSLVRAGLGLTMVPRLVAEPLVTGVPLYPVDGLPLTRTVSVAVRAGSEREPAVAALRAALCEAAGDRPAPGQDEEAPAVRPADGGPAPGAPGARPGAGASAPGE